jgi:hypothetical protein
MKRVERNLPMFNLTYFWLTALGVLLSGSFLMTLFVGEATAEPVPGNYKVVGGRVDRGTYRGWKVFHTNCYGCHGVDALGTDVAPSLVERVKLLSPREFSFKVLTRYRIVVPSSEAAGDDQTAIREAVIEEVLKQERGKKGEILMPPWESQSAVKPHVLDLYAYLSARADGVLGPGRPKLLKKK